MPSENNRVTLADEKDRFGLTIARVTFSYGDNDKRLIRHSMGSMRRCLDAAGARELWDEDDDTCHLNGTARMGDDPRTQRRQRRLPQLGHPQFVDLRRLGVSDRRRRQPVADDPGDRLPHRRPHPRARRARRALSELRGAAEAGSASSVQGCSLGRGDRLGIIMLERYLDAHRHRHGDQEPDHAEQDRAADE